MTSLATTIEKPKNSLVGTKRLYLKSFKKINMMRPSEEEETLTKIRVAEDVPAPIPTIIP